VWHDIRSNINQVVLFLNLRSLQLASELWPGSATVEADDGESHADADGGEVEEDLEKQIAKELASIKRPRKEQRFGMLHLHRMIQTSESNG
jgi:hypothetical protein